MLTHAKKNQYSKLETERRKMHHISGRYGMQSNKTLEQSRLVDILILQQMKIINRY